MTPAAQWLNSTFAGFDRAILGFYHYLATIADPILNPISKFFDVIGDGALACFVLAAILLLFKKTRKAGIAVLLAVGVGALLTNVAIKNLVARPRPYVSDFVEWWQYVGSHVQSEYSFPSGHTTAAMTGMTALCLTLGKKHKWLFPVGALYVLLMGASRNYLMVHYPSDILGGIIIGAIAGTIAYFLAKLIYKIFEENYYDKVCSFILNASVVNLFKKKTTQE